LLAWSLLAIVGVVGGGIWILLKGWVQSDENQ
jgi:hypothetical protein